MESRRCTFSFFLPRIFSNRAILQYSTLPNRKLALFYSSIIYLFLPYLAIANAPPPILIYVLLDWISITDRHLELQNSSSIFANKEKIHNYYLFTMKYLEVPSLSVLSSKMNQVTQSDMKLNCRIELYSCESCLCEWIVGKMSTEQKKLSRKLRQDLLRDSEDAFVTISESTNILWKCR